jgi:DNA-binding CsgD family transcriptional regulator/PAS domain-containing protein
MISLEAFSELLEVLYSVPLRQERWGHFLDLLCEHTGSMSSFLICANSQVGLSIQEQGGAAFDPAIIASYAEKYAFKDPYRLPLARAGTTGVLDCNELVPNEQLWESDMYRHLNEPSGVRYPGLMVMTLSMRRFEVISFWRTLEQGPMHRDANRLLEMLLPHVRSAMEIRYALGAVEARAKGAEAMADASRTATFLLTGRGEVVHRNAAAAELLERRDGLALAMRAGLRSLLREAASPGAMGAGAGKAMLLERDAGRSPLQLLASPAPHYGDGGYAVLLLVSDREKPADVPDEMMRAYFGFTSAETEIANGLLTGYTLEEIAALRRVALGTVRFQIKSLLRKTATSRQADLVRVLLTLPQVAAARI